MPIFGGRLGSRADELQHLLQAADNGHDEVAYIFYILMVEYNNSMVEVEEALVHVDKFITSSLADQTIQKWICSVRCDDVLMLLRYEDLGWERQFFADVHDLPQCHIPRCQMLIFKKAWQNKRWMTSCTSAQIQLKCWIFYTNYICHFGSCTFVIFLKKCVNLFSKQEKRIYIDVPGSIGEYIKDLATC
jgi:hypothetical protein